MTSHGIPERIMELLCRLAGTAYHIGRCGADAPGPNTEDLAEAVPQVERPIRVAERELQELVAGAIGSAVLLGFEEARRRGYIGWKPRNYKEIEDIIGKVAAEVISRRLVVEATMRTPEEIQ